MYLYAREFEIRATLKMKSFIAFLQPFGTQAPLDASRPPQRVMIDVYLPVGGLSNVDYQSDANFQWRVSTTADATEHW